MGALVRVALHPARAPAVVMLLTLLARPILARGCWQDAVDTLYHDIREGLEIDMYQVSIREGACAHVLTRLECRVRMYVCISDRRARHCRCAST